MQDPNVSPRIDDAPTARPSPEAVTASPDAAREARILHLGPSRNARSFELPLPPPPPGTPESRRLGRHARLVVCLGRLSKPWLKAITRRHALDLHGPRAAIEVALAGRLSAFVSVRKSLLRLPVQSRRRITYLLAVGGWSLQSRYASRFPDDLPFSEWDWDSGLPRSPLGRLRAAGLVFLGKARKDGRECDIIMIPREIREVLSILDWEDLPFSGDRGGRTPVDRDARDTLAGSPWRVIGPEPITSNGSRAFLEGDSLAVARPPLQSTIEGDPAMPRPSPLQLAPARQGITLSGLLTDARKALGRERYALAAHLFMQAATIEPHAAEPFVQLGLIALDEDSPGHEAIDREALGKARRFLEKGRRLAILHRARGIQGPNRTGDPPALLLAYHGLARVALAEGRLREAALLLRRLLELDPKDRFEARFLLPETFHRMEEPDHAAKLYRELLDAERADRRPDPWFDLGLALTEQGILEEALLVWRAAALRNLYVVPRLLGTPASRHRVHHAGPAEETGWAARYVERTRDLWAGQPEALELLARLWTTRRATSERRAQLTLASQARAEKNGEVRARLVEERRHLASLEILRQTHEQVLDELGVCGP